MNKTDILDVMSRKLAPFILLFGLYLVSYGHLSPGGGFQGGVVIASAVMLLLLGRGSGRSGVADLSRILAGIESVALAAFLLAGVAGLLLSGSFLGEVIAPGAGGGIADAGGILLLNTIVGIKVGAGVSLISCLLLREMPSCPDT